MSFMLKGKSYIPGLEQYMPPKMRNRIDDPREPPILGPVEHRSPLDELAELVAGLTFDEMLELGDALLAHCEINSAFTLAVAFNGWAKLHRNRKTEDN